MKWVDKLLIVLGTVAALNGYSQTKKDSTKLLLDTLQTGEKSESKIIIVEQGLVPKEQLDWEDGYPLGTILIEETDKTYIINKLWEKYSELYETDTVLISIDAISSLDKLIKSWMIHKWSRVGFETNKKFITLFFVYEEKYPKCPACIKNKK